MNRHIGDFELLRPLGAGAMGEVMLARRKTDGSLVAVKRLRVAAGRGAKKRLEREGKTLVHLNSENIVKLIDVVTDRDDICLVLEYVDGPTLSSLVAAQTLDVADALATIAQLVAALTYVHGRGLVHRDVKSSNVLLSSKGVAKLNDFGVVRLLDVVTGVPIQMTALTREGLPLGTAAYMSPEAVRGDTTLDQRADLYSLGILSYELLTGRLPFLTQANLAQVLHAQLNSVPPPPQTLVAGFPEGVARSILRALEKDPADRQSSVEDFWGELGGAAAESWPFWWDQADLVGLSQTARKPKDESTTSEEHPMSALQPVDVGVVTPVTPLVPKLRRRRRSLHYVAAAASGLVVAVGVFELVTHIFR